MTRQILWPGGNAPLESGFATFQNSLSKGKNVLTVHILTNGNMNLAYFDFKPVRR
jgi:hypothetical protein